MYSIFFFFSSRRRHTRLQGDWSSDVCSSDLPFWWDHPAAAQRATPERREHWLKDLRGDGAGIISALSAVVAPAFPRALRSEERRVGKECRSRWSPYH